MRSISETLKKDLSVDGKIRQLEAAGWEIKQSAGHYLCGYPHKNAYLYQIVCNSRQEIADRLFYASIGQKQQLAEEFGTTVQELSYIKTGIRSGKTLKNKEQVWFYLQQTIDRPFDITEKKLRKKNDEDIKMSLLTSVNALSEITGMDFKVEFDNPEKGTKSSITLKCDEIPIFVSSPASFGEVQSFIHSCFQLQHKSFSEDFDFIQSLLAL